MLVFAFRSEIWIVQTFNFTVFEDFCLSLSWKYRFLHNVNHAKVQSKTNKYCKFHVDLTRRRLSKSRFQKVRYGPPKTVSRHLKTIRVTNHALNRGQSCIQRVCSLFKRVLAAKPWETLSALMCMSTGKRTPLDGCVSVTDVINVNFFSSLFILFCLWIVILNIILTISHRRFGTKFDR